MANPFEELAGLDRLVHDPTRMAILAALSACQEAEFLYLVRITGLTRGNMSGHLAKLEEAGLVCITKEFVGKIPRTSIRLTPAGRKAIERHWKRLEELRKGARDWQPPER